MIYSIDPHTGGLAYIERGEDKSSFNEFIENLEINCLSKRIKVIKNTAQEVIENTLISYTVRFSLVFVDGLHTSEGVEKDSTLCKDKRKKNVRFWH